jgi:hypothetical protein
MLREKILVMLNSSIFSGKWEEEGLREGRQV